MKSIRLRNFRNLSDTGNIQIKPLTILVGCNSSGKSSFLRSLPLMKQSFGVQKHGPILWYKEDGVDFNDFATTVKNGQKNIVINWDGVDFHLFPWMRHFDLKNIYANIEITICEDPSDSNYDKISNLKVEYLGNSICLSFNKNEIVPISINNQDFEPLMYSSQGYLTFFPTLKYKNENNIVGFENLIEILKDNEKYKYRNCSDFLTLSLQDFQELLEGKEFNYNKTQTYYSILYYNITDLLLFIERGLYYYFSNVSYIGPFRNTPLRYYRLQNLSTNNIDMKGSNMAVFINGMSKAQFEEFNKRIYERYRFQLIRKQEFGHISLFIKKENDNKETNIVDNGFGYSQIMPILLSLYGVNKESNSSFDQILCIEQPALHLHPKMQYQLGESFVDFVSMPDTNNKIIIETHSRSVIEAIGYNVYKNKDLREKVVVYLFDKKDNEIEVKESVFDEEGYLTNWPLGFLD